jgi:hypothetical protein
MWFRGGLPQTLSELSEGSEARMQFSDTGDRTAVSAGLGMDASIGDIAQDSVNTALLGVDAPIGGIAEERSRSVEVTDNSGTHVVEIADNSAW